MSVLLGSLFTEDESGGMTRDAVLSPCGSYRYKLTRRWGPGRKCVFVMLNPSTANAEVDDPTIRRCIAFARSWGYAGLDVVNLFPFRATSTKVLKAARDPYGGDQSNYAILAACQGSELVVCAWGKDGNHLGRARDVCWLLDQAGVQLHALKLNGDGTPAHPLYLKGDLQPFAWTGQ